MGQQQQQQQQQQQPQVIIDQPSLEIYGILSSCGREVKRERGREGKRTCQAEGRMRKSRGEGENGCQNEGVSGVVRVSG